ncbi:MAG TPA: CxxC-x17-CxxC domain-containing protein, partial [Planctomycetota bacterium]|nr:CxxC-x17-CxxC domain-containing protein [Planctomycetota bacterium]
QGQGFKVTCSGCGVETSVPFKPDPNRPVYCRTCYLDKKKSGNR